MCGNQENAFNPERTTEANNWMDGQYTTGLIERAEIPNGSNIRDDNLCPNTVSSLHHVTERIVKNNYSHRQCRSAWVGCSGPSVCLSFVSLFVRSITQERMIKVFKLDTGNDLRISQKWCGFGVERSRSQGQ